MPFGSIPEGSTESQLGMKRDEEEKEKEPDVLWFLEGGDRYGFVEAISETRKLIDDPTLIAIKNMLNMHEEDKAITSVSVFYFCGYRNHNGVPIYEEVQKLTL